MLICTDSKLSYVERPFALSIVLVEMTVILIGLA